MIQTAKPHTGSLSSTGDMLSGAELLLSEKSAVTYRAASGRQVTAFNGFIAATSGCGWQEAVNFVEFLNDNLLKPFSVVSPSHGAWRLLNSAADAKAWADATIGDELGFRGVSYLWSANMCPDIPGASYVWSCCWGDWDVHARTDRSPQLGFVVIWEPI